MINPIVPQIAGAYGLKVAEYLPMQTGYRNKNFPVFLENGKTINIIIYKREPNMYPVINNANRISNFLGDKGFPARSSFDLRILRLTNTQPKQYAAIYNYLPGNTIPWEAYTMNHIKLLGKCMSDMHSYLSEQPKKNLQVITDICNTQLLFMRKYFDDNGVKNALSSKLDVQISPGIQEKFENLLRYCDQLPNQQPLHMDFVRSNILFSENLLEISGVLDFEKTAYGNPVFDIARTLAFLLVDCKYKTEEQVYKYFLQSGYNKRGNAKYMNQFIKTKKGSFLLVDELVNYFLFYDFYKFLKHNPYESLKSNEHFVRTLEALLTRMLLTSASANKLVK